MEKVSTRHIVTSFLALNHHIYRSPYVFMWPWWWWWWSWTNYQEVNLPCNNVIKGFTICIWLLYIPTTDSMQEPCSITAQSHNYHHLCLPSADITWMFKSSIGRGWAFMSFDLELSLYRHEPSPALSIYSIRASVWTTSVWKPHITWYTFP